MWLDKSVFNVSFLSEPASLSYSPLHVLQEEKDKSGEELLGQNQTGRMGPPWSQEVSGLCFCL